MNFKSVISSVISRGAAALLLAAVAISCNTIYDDQSDCPRGVSLRFVYDYNMEFANSFHTQAHCLNVYLFDKDGNYLDNWIETGEVLKDENWRMKRELGEGSYTLIAYAGLCCGESSFTAPQLKTRAASRIEEVSVSLNHNNFTSDASLHSLFYGMATLEVGKDDYMEETIYLKKDTNNIRFALQQMNGEQITADEFEVSIVDDNTVLDWQNEPVPAGLVTYKPWVKGETVIGSAEDGETPVSAAYYELSTSRLTTSTSPRLIVYNKERGENIINIPLNTYLLFLKSELYAEMPAQEFLDRVSEWSLIFFLDSGNRWYNAKIVVNDWVVRLNDAEL
ncbi:MAG: FimB/Mfa2 family fimbrial subunit [Candidatus Cryptobacteroides sp.]